MDSIFFLGAGFSKAICDRYPLMRDLSRILLGENSSKFDYARNIPQIIINNSDNFEKILTYLSTDLPWKKEYQKLSDKAEYLKLTKKIHDHFSINLAHTDLNYDKFKALWAYILIKGSPVITLNYDLIVEKNLQLINHQILNPRVSVVLTDYESLDEFYRGTEIDIKSKIGDIFNLTEKMPEILKLHGSVNWYYSEADNTNQIYCANKDTEIEKKLIGNYAPYIIPPILDKKSLYNHRILQYLWTKAYDYLKQAKKIYIIGFSFPETDLAVKYLFESALSNNRYNPEIFIVDTNTTDEFKNKYKSLLGDNCIFDYCKENALETFIKQELITQLKSEMITSINNQTKEEHLEAIFGN